MYVKIVVNNELLPPTMKIQIIKVNESIFSYEKCSFVVGIKSNHSLFWLYNYSANCYLGFDGSGFATYVSCSIDPSGVDNCYVYWTLIMYRGLNLLVNFYLILWRSLILWRQMGMGKK